MNEPIVYRGGRRRKSSGRRRAKNPKSVLYKDFNCIDKVRGTIRCIGSDKICNTEDHNYTCVPADPTRLQRGERGMSPAMVQAYTNAFGGDFAEDTEMGIFGRKATVAAHRAQYVKDYPALWSFTKGEIAAALRYRGIPIPEGVRTYNQLREFALSMGITPSVVENTPQLPTGPDATTFAPANIPRTPGYVYPPFMAPNAFRPPPEVVDYYQMTSQSAFPPLPTINPPPEMFSDELPTTSTYPLPTSTQYSMRNTVNNLVSRRLPPRPPPRPRSPLRPPTASEFTARVFDNTFGCRRSI